MATSAEGSRRNSFDSETSGGAIGQLHGRDIPGLMAQLSPSFKRVRQINQSLGFYFNRIVGARAVGKSENASMTIRGRKLSLETKSARHISQGAAAFVGLIFLGLNLVVESILGKNGIATALSSMVLHALAVLLSGITRAVVSPIVTVLKPIAKVLFYTVVALAVILAELGLVAAHIALFALEALGTVVVFATAVAALAISYIMTMVAGPAINEYNRRHAADKQIRQPFSVVCDALFGSPNPNNEPREKQPSKVLESLKQAHLALFGLMKAVVGLNDKPVEQKLHDLDVAERVVAQPAQEENKRPGPIARLRNFAANLSCFSAGDDDVAPRTSHAFYPPRQEKAAQKPKTTHSVFQRTKKTTSKKTDDSTRKPYSSADGYYGESAGERTESKRAEDDIDANELSAPSPLSNNNGKRPSSREE